jgi:hypothetical protein
MAKWNAKQDEEWSKAQFEAQHNILNLIASLAKTPGKETQIKDLALALQALRAGKIIS